MDTTEKARAWIREARSIAAITGAGISAESGIPTFRGAGGLWKQYRPEDLATPQAFAAQPELVWEWYEWRRGLIAKAEPNAGHFALAELERRTPIFSIATQNVDGLHRRAGSQNVFEIHGSIWTVRCTRCGAESTDDRVPLPAVPPRCESCGGLLRPGVVWFGEALPPGVWDNAQQAVQSAELVLVIGTSAVVYPAASLAPLAKRSGTRVIEINPDPTPISAAVDVVLRGNSGVILPQLIE